jgi:hypothetical protein
VIIIDPKYLAHFSNSLRVGLNIELLFFIDSRDWFSRVRDSKLNNVVQYYPDVKNMLLQCTKCNHCSFYFLNTWLECVKFVDLKKVSVRHYEIREKPRNRLFQPIIKGNEIKHSQFQAGVGAHPCTFVFV